MFGDDAWKLAQWLLIVCAALAVVGCVSIVRWIA
jgi:hypothetical protein